jgi:tripartite-type tricarboxylate transporter receptor subunit TctC
MGPRFRGGDVSNSFAYRHRREGVDVGVVDDDWRSAFAPELPSVAESGLPGYDVFGWNGVLATGGTPRPVIEKLPRFSSPP